MDPARTGETDYERTGKSKSLVLKKGKVLDSFCFSIGGTPIPSVSKKLVKSLGMVISSRLKDTISVQATCEELESWSRIVDWSGVPGKFEAWTYQNLHRILPRILWPLSVYNVSISIIENMEWKVSSNLTNCLGLARSLDSTVLCGLTPSSGCL